MANWHRTCPWPLACIRIDRPSRGRHSWMGWPGVNINHYMHYLMGNTSLQEAQTTLQLHAPYFLRVVPGDNHCFYHCVLSAHGEAVYRRRDTSMLTITDLKRIAEHPTDSYAEHFHIIRVCNHFRFRVRIYPTLIEPSATPRWADSLILGEDGPVINIVWWFRAQGENPIGVHFDLLDMHDDFGGLGWRELQDACRSSSFRAPRHWRKLHMLAYLRRDQHPGQAPPRPPPPRSQHRPLSFNLMVWNVLSARRRQEEIRQHAASQSPSFLVLTESWQHLPTIDGYQLVVHSCRASTKGGGVAIYAQNGIIASGRVGACSCDAFEYVFVETTLGSSQAPPHGLLCASCQYLPCS